jgi:hypothetical protein
MPIINYSVDCAEWTRYYRMVEVPEGLTPEETREFIIEADSEGAYDECGTKYLDGVGGFSAEFNFPEGVAK